MDFDSMKKDKDFQKWCFDTELVINKNWFNLENGSGDEVYIAYEAWIAGQQSKQAEIDALKNLIDGIVGIVREADLSDGDSSVAIVHDKIQELLK